MYKGSIQFGLFVRKKRDTNKKQKRPKQKLKYRVSRFWLHLVTFPETENVRSEKRKRDTKHNAKFSSVHAKSRNESLATCPNDSRRFRSICIVHNRVQVSTSRRSFSSKTRGKDGTRARGVVRHRRHCCRSCCAIYRTRGKEEGETRWATWVKGSARWAVS